VKERQAIALIGPGEERLNLGLIADEQNAQIGVGGDGLHGAGHDWSRRVVAPHRVQGNEHKLLLLFGLHDFAALIVSAIGADVMRQHRLLAAAAVLDLHRFDVQVTAAFALAGVRGSSLRNSHDSFAFRKMQG
jgi:hypothetical protein